MKIIVFFFSTLLMGLVTKSQIGSIKIYNSHCLTEFSSDSSMLDINFIIVNDDTVEYFYPKATSQIVEGNVLYYSYHFLKYHRVQNITLDVGSVGNNDFDRLVSIKPFDTLVIKYVNIPISGKPQDIIIQNYISTNAQSLMPNTNSSKNLSKNVKGIKIIKYRLSYDKGRISDTVEFRNYF